MGLSYEQIDDLVNGTLSHFDRPNFGMIATKLTKYIAMQDLFRKGVADFLDVLDSGKDIQDELMVTHKDSARHTEFYEEDTYVLEDNLKKINTPWRFTTENFLYDIREVPINGPASRLVNFLEKKRLNALLSIAVKLERTVFGKPSSSDDAKTPWGIQYWLKPPEVSGALGHNGGNVTGFSNGPGGLSADTYDSWKNYNGRYDSFDALPEALKKTARNTAFESPVRVSGMKSEKITRRIWCGENVIENIDKLAQANNDNLGTDLGTYGDDGVTFKRTPFTYVPQMDVDFDQDDIFMLDTNSFGIKILGDGNMKETGPKDVKGRHNSRAVYYDYSWNMSCNNRRNQAWLQK